MRTLNLFRFVFKQIHKLYFSLLNNEYNIVSIFMSGIIRTVITMDSKSFDFGNKIREYCGEEM